MTRPYLIGIFDYRNSSAGIRVMHRLCHELNARGQEAYVTGAPNRAWNEVRALATDMPTLLSRGAIAVYPEVIYGNPLGAGRVARYILNVPGLLGGDTTYDLAEMLFCYSPRLREYVSDNGRILNLPVIELELFNAAGVGARSGIVWYRGKGAACRMPPGTIEITWQWPTTRCEVAGLLRRAEWFVTSDCMTALITEARLCGCPVLLLSDGSCTRQQWAMWNGPLNGVAWGNDPTELEWARQTVENFALWYQAHIVIFPHQMERFIAITQGGGLG